MTYYEYLDKLEEMQLARAKEELERMREYMQKKEAPVVRVYPGINIVNVRRTK